MGAGRDDRMGATAGGSETAHGSLVNISAIRKPELRRMNLGDLLTSVVG